ncbi:MAG: hypothetical protein HGB33_12230 [Syntrophaceae bacterium]|nr:hypothetical protein [Syntrophaceae bacterium]
MMKIDIDQLSESELIDLNRRIVERLRFLQHMRTHVSMLEFSIGERVCFQPDNRPAIYGIITKYNQKTVTVITETGERWNVSPSLLKKADIKTKVNVIDNIIKIPKK